MDVPRGYTVTRDARWLADELERLAKYGAVSSDGEWSLDAASRHIIAGAADELRAALRVAQASPVAWRWKLKDADLWEYQGVKPATKHPAFEYEPLYAAAALASPAPAAAEGDGLAVSFENALHHHRVGSLSQYMAQIATALAALESRAREAEERATYWRNAAAKSADHFTAAAARAEKAEKERDEAGRLLGTRYMDPPDGGDPTLPEMVKNVLAHVAELERALAGAEEWLSGWASAEPYLSEIRAALPKADKETG